MRVLHAIPYMHPRAGGPPAVVANLVRHMVTLGCESRIVFTPLFSDGDADSLAQRVNRMAPATMLSQGGFGLFRDKHARALVSDMVGWSDVVHVHTLWNPLNRLVADACNSHRRPYVLMPHGMLDPYSLGVRRWRKRAYLAAVEHRHLRQATRMIYTASEEQRLAASQVPNLPSGAVVGLGAEVPAVEPAVAAEEFVDAFPVVRNRRQLLFLGRLHEKKGIDRILAAFTEILCQHDDVVLTIVGSGAPEFEADIRTDIERRGLRDRVLMTGFLDGTLKWGAYASATLFLLPSRQENFALSVAEAMHSGVPVVVSDRVNTWPYVRDAAAGVVLEEVGIENRLAGTVNSLLSAPSDMAEMGKRGQRYARSHLTWRRSAESVFECYTDVLSGAEKNLATDTTHA